MEISCELSKNLSTQTKPNMKASKRVSAREHGRTPMIKWDLRGMREGELCMEGMRESWRWSVLVLFFASTQTQKERKRRQTVGI